MVYVKRFPWRLLIVVNSVLIAAQLTGGYWIADRIVKGWPTDE